MRNYTVAVLNEDGEVVWESETVTYDGLSDSDEFTDADGEAIVREAVS
jgi:hypothetical protein